MYDVFYLYYNDYQEENFNQLKKFCPFVKQISNISGIWNAHYHCANQAKTNYFFVVDADCFVYENVFNEIGEENFVKVFRSLNPINGLIYGWGGIKLFPKELILNTKIPEKYLDMTTNWNIKVIDTLASENRFNTNEFSTWRSAYREVTKIKYWIHKLLDNSWKEDKFFSWIDTNEKYENFLNTQQERLNVWCKIAFKHKDFYEYSLKGANQAIKDFDLEKIHLINNYEYLEKYFKHNCQS